MKIDGRIVVDAASYFHNNPSEKHDPADLASESVTPQFRITDNSHISSPSWICGTGRMMKMALQNEIRQRKIESGELPTERKMEPVKWRRRGEFHKFLFLKSPNPISPVHVLTNEQLCSTIHTYEATH